MAARRGTVDTTRESDVVINPLKHSQSIGAAIAFQGIDRAVPVIHGAQGCTFLAKALISRHYKEPIALASTKLFAEDVIMGSDDSLVKTASDLAQKQAPDVIAVLSSGLTEVKGDDHRAAINTLQMRHDRTMFVYVSTPDFQGGLEEGYRAAIEAVVETLGEGIGSPCVMDRPQVNVIAGCFLSPADISELRDVIESFGLQPLFLPDLSALDGSRRGVSPLALGGVSLSDLKTIPRSIHTLVIGQSLERCAKLLKSRYGVSYTVFRGVSALADVDGLIETISVISGKPAAKRLLRQRSVAVDGVKDAQFYFTGKRVCIALEAEHAVSVSRLLAEMGAEAALCVIASNTASAKDIAAAQVRVGDLFSINEEFDLLISTPMQRIPLTDLELGCIRLASRYLAYWV
ncbi:MAG: hypothetical protein HQL06_14910 [Nitrospirae bacterium]|nr:hypothetical protein [Nitrospirota bacterium]